MPGYTLLCAVAVVLTWGLGRVLGTRLLRDPRYWIALGIIALFQFLVDGWLTCRPIVTYDEAQFSGVRFGCSLGDPWPRLGRTRGMPAEDLVFGWAMVTQTLQWWLWWGRRRAAEGPARGPFPSRQPGSAGG